MNLLDWPSILLIPVFMAALFWIGTIVCVAIFIGRRDTADEAFFPFVSLIRPVCGLEKNLKNNLSSACRQVYPAYEVIFCVQKNDDPALPVVKEVVRHHASQHVRAVVDEGACGMNGKVCNLYNASQVAKGEVLVVADTDMFLEADYLHQIVAPLSQDDTGVSCAIFLARRPANIFEALELLSYNTDFTVSIIFAMVTGTALACTGANMGIRNGVLREIGGLASLGDYYVEDYELGCRVAEKGYRIRFIPYTVKMSLDINNLGEWWRHQVCWDQKTKSANPPGFFLSLLVRGIPFACLYAATGGAYGISILMAAVGLRITISVINAALLRDRYAIKYIWLLPLRDILGLFVWVAGLVKSKGYWRGRSFFLKRGRMMARKA